ncbi:MAG: tetratricopeptide repeat protein, partial [Dolichospermum sp.]
GKGENLGYDLFLSGSPRPGISGSPILNDQGEVFGMYGKADFGSNEDALLRDGVQGITTEKFPNLISKITDNIPDNTQANTPGNIDDYNLAIKINPNDADAYHNRGNVRSALGDKQGAIDDYNQAIKINPNYALAYNNRGIVRYDLGDKQGAIDDYNQAIKINPKK